MDTNTQRRVVRADRAPKAVGPYSQAIAASGFLFTAGQIPLDPQTGDIVGSDVATQTRRVMENVKAILEDAGTSLSKVVKCTVFLTDMAKFGDMNGVYAEYFTSEPPARSTIQVVALPKGAQVEIEVVALL